MSIVLKQPSVLPGFGLTLGFTLFYLSLIVLIPLGRSVRQDVHHELGPVLAGRRDPRASLHTSSRLGLRSWPP